MPLRTVDLLDKDFKDAYELISDGYLAYLTTTLVSTVSGTQTVTINLPFDGEGLITGLDHPAEAGDLVHLSGTISADGYYTISSVLTDLTFTVVESIASSTGGSIIFFYPPGAAQVGFDPTYTTHIHHNTVQKALEDLDSAITPSSGLTATEVEVDFGSIPTRSKTFTIIDINVTLTSKLIITQSGKAPTGRSADENEMDPITFSGTPGLGQFILIASALNGPVVGKYKVNYAIG